MAIVPVVAVFAPVNVSINLIGQTCPTAIDSNYLVIICKIFIFTAAIL